jgi:hypothetical protein
MHRWWLGRRRRVGCVDGLCSVELARYGVGTGVLLQCVD